MTKKLFLFLLCVFAFQAVFSQPRNRGHFRRMAFATDTVMAHDPVMAYENGTYYLLSTGMGIQWATSRDRKTWVVQSSPFIENLPKWTADSVPGFTSHVWAPDVIRWHDRWWLTYSCSTFGKNTSAIGLMSSDRLNGAWKDHGCVVKSQAKRDEWNAIDSNIAIDDDDQPWMVWGSFWDGIQIARLNLPTTPNDQTTNLPISQTTNLLNDQTTNTLTDQTTIARRYRKGDPNAAENPTSKFAGRNSIEAPFIFKKNGYYYLLVSWDYCCRGAKSNYRVAVGRSKTITGPYLDKNGKDMRNGGGTILIEGDKKEFEAAGHCSAYTFPTANGGTEDIFVCHGYSVTKNGMALLVQRPIEWTKDGWPKLK
jgi:arabinan endo-1,5-alpha-L-arabinosidase